MIYGIFCIRDSKTGFMTPSFDINPDSAIRNFAHSLVAGPSVVTTFSKDFDLYEIGLFNSESGVIIPSTPPAFIFSGSDALSLGKKMLGGSDDDVKV